MNATVLEKQGYVKSADGALRPRPYRPSSIGDARKLINEVFERNRWDRDDQARYFKMKGIEATRLEDLTAEDIRTVISSMENSRMMNFQD